jgi:predicted transcriptional regulator YdeE
MQNVIIEPFNLIGISVKTTNESGQAVNDIPKLWEKFMSENKISNIPGKVNDVVYSLYTEYEHDHTGPYTAMLGCKVENLDNIPDGMIGKSFNGGSYLKLTTKGDLTSGLIVNEWMKIWEMDIDRAYTADFEIYDERSANPANAEVDILVAIK